MASSAPDTTLFIGGNSKAKRLQASGCGLPRMLWPELMAAVEFGFEFARVEVFADVSQSLLELEQCVGYAGFIRKCNVAPHRVRAGGYACHLAECPPAGFK